MSKNCEHIMEKFYSLDKNELIPFGVSLHLLFCKKCRSEVRILTKAEKLIASRLHEKINPDSEEITNIVNNVITEQKKNEKPVSFVSWTVAGILLFSIFTFVSFFSRSQASSLQFSLGVFTGFVFTFFVFGFLAANLDFFIKKAQKFDTHHLLAM